MCVYVDVCECGVCTCMYVSCMYMYIYIFLYFFVYPLLMHACDYVCFCVCVSACFKTGSYSAGVHVYPKKSGQAGNSWHRTCLILLQRKVMITTLVVVPAEMSNGK